MGSVMAAVRRCPAASRFAEMRWAFFPNCSSEAAALPRSASNFATLAERSARRAPMTAAMFSFSALLPDDDGAQRIRHRHDRRAYRLRRHITLRLEPPHEGFKLGEALRPAHRLALPM